MTLTHTSRPHTSNQAGMVSIMVTMIMMLVISLIVLGFSQISRREQRETLDRQLSSQAFFAAESGINDARHAIAEAQANGKPIAEKTDCATSTSDTDYPFNPVIDADNNVSYTCLLVTTKLKNIHISPLAAGGDSVSVPLQPDGGPMQTMHVSWTALTTPSAAQVAACSGNIPPSGSFPKAAPGSWNCPYGVLRMDIVSTDTLNRSALAASQKTIFLYPTKDASPATQDYGTANGAVARMACNVTGCDVDITNMPASTATYGVRLSAIYTSGSVDITAKGAGNTAMELNNAQIQVDATGKAEDVLRRVQVRLAMAPAGKTPDFAIESASSVCKRYEIDNDLFTIPSDIMGQDQKNPMCRPLSVKPPCQAAPKDIAMVLDDSLSMKNGWNAGGGGGGLSRLDKLKEVSLRFIQNAGISATGNHEAVLPFNSAPPQNPTPPLRTPLTFSTTLLSDTINALSAQGTHCCTQYLTGLQYANDALALGRPGIDKIVVFISDGIPTDGDSRTPDIAAIQASAQALKDKGYTVYTIGITDDSAQATDVLAPMASDPSKYVFAKNATDLDKAIDDITATLVCH